MLTYREFEHIENSKRLVLEIVFREADGKMKSASGLVKSGFEPKGGFRNWCKEMAAMVRNYDYLFFNRGVTVSNFDKDECDFGWDSATLIRTGQVCEFSRKHPNGFMGIIQLKKEKENV
jgi:hypothetical protein